jgi:diguanylate cyclase (GGDEF)-like protein/PAS domain S-box-containing protein
MAILLFANSVLLFTKQHGFCPVSHRLTGTAFAVSAGVSLVRAIYYLVWNTDAHQAVYQHNFIQDISYLTTSFIIVGTSFGFLLMCNDKYVTEKNRAQLAQQEALDRFQILFDRASDGIVLVDLNGQLIKVNKSFAQMHGYTPEEMQTMKLRDLGTPVTLRLLPERMQRILSRKSMIFELEHYHKEGHIFPLEISASLIFSNGEPLIQSFVRDITERKADEETIKQLAFYDPLTNLPNRRLLNERLKHCIEINHRTGSKTAVLMMDLDKFKAVNDSLGHAAGDELLKQVAERIKAHLREIDMVARLGGDEFVILIDEVNHYEDLAHVAKAIIHTLSQSFTLWDSHHVTIGASIGIAIHPEHGNAMEELMDNADTALYQAKNSGRGCFACFS